MGREGMMKIDLEAVLEEETPMLGFLKDEVI